MSTAFVLRLLVYSTCLLTARAAAPPHAGDVVFERDFEGGALPGKQTPQVRLTSGYQSEHAVEVAVSSNSSAGSSMTFDLPFEQVRGARLLCEAMVKAEAVSPPPKPWNGVKFMLHITAPGGSTWPQENNVHGTFDWKKLQFTTRVPRDATAATLVLGLEAVTGRARFDNVRVRVLNPPRPLAAAAPAGPVYKGHTLPRLRGVMLGANVTAADLRELGRDWGANHVRWQLIWGGFPRSPADKGDLDAYDAWMEGQLRRLETLLPVCDEAGLKVLIDIHTPPGGRNDSSQCQLFHEKRFQESFITWWDKISARFKQSKAVWGYDLVNEPVVGTLGDGCLGWQELATAAARVVRKNDPDHAIVIEPEPWGGPESMENLEPLPVPGVVYSAHMYLPHHFTHQGVYDKSAGLVYPGEIDGKHWDKERLRKALQPMVDFQRAYGVAIYIGEFSAIRWAPDDSAFRYLKDCIEIFEENGWDWAYHAFREWDGWSVEHGADKSDHTRSKTPTSRKTLLREWFAKNSKP